MAKLIVSVLVIIAIILGVWNFYEIMYSPNKLNLLLKIFLGIILVAAEIALFMLLFVALM